MGRSYSYLSKWSIGLAWAISLVITFNVAKLGHPAWDRSLRNVNSGDRQRFCGAGSYSASSVAGYSPGGHPVGVEDIAVLINTAHSHVQWHRNYENIFSVWGSSLPYVYWFSNFSSGVPPKRPHMIGVKATGVAERYMMMVGAALKYVPSHVKWIISVDEDTYLFIENLLDALADYDPSLPWYIGDWSEDAQGLDWYTRMAYGGGGVAMSRPVVQALSTQGEFDVHHCASRYERVDTGDEKLARCIADLGVDLTRRFGFHQVDIRGDVRPVLWHAFSKHPLISLHHVYAHWPIFMVEDGPLQAMKRLFRSYNVHRTRHNLFMSLYFRHFPDLGITIAVNVGHSVRIWFGMVPTKLFTNFVPELDYGPWQPRLGKGYSSFDAYPVSTAFACTSAYFEWGPSDVPITEAFVQTYWRAMTHPNCKGLQLKSEKKLIEKVYVAHAPCNADQPALLVEVFAPTEVALRVTDCRRSKLETYPRSDELNFDRD